MLRPQDIVVLCKLICLRDEGWAIASLSEQLGISASEIHAGLRRAAQARLYLPDRKSPVELALLEFLEHGIRYAFAVERGPLARGVISGHGVPGLGSEYARAVAEAPIVWPDPQGKARGESIAPLCRSVPFAVRQDPCLHRLLGLVDAVRVGGARERRVAAQLIKKMVVG